MNRLVRLQVWAVILFFPLLATAQGKQDSMKITLDQAITMALSENPTIKIADREIEVKKNYRKEQIATIFPDASLSASYSRTLLKQTQVMEMGGQMMEISFGTDNNYSAGLALTLPVVAPALWNNLKLTKLDIELAMESARSSKISLVNEIKKAYYNLLLAQDSYEVLLLNFNNVEMNFQNISAKYEQGLASEFDKLRAEVQVKNQIPNLKSASSNIELATMLLKVLIGVDLNEPIIFTGSLADFEAQMIADKTPVASQLSLSNNTDLKQLDLNLNQLDMSLRVIRSSALPTLGINGSYQTSSMNNNFKFGEYAWHPYSYVALGLSVPIVSWVGTSYKMKSTKLNITSLEEQKKYVEDNLRVSVQNSITQINNAKEEMVSNRETVTQAEKAYNISQKQYDVGMATWLDLSAAELALTNARLLYNQSIYNYLTASADLEKVLGNQ
ncbi:MAG: TolC family protein [Bacteroidales bacterium]|jgi:outer membrane protein TolC|nr:TolC family protein [Bacteroidales bacterium]